MSTLEQRLKFDLGLTIGDHSVLFTNGRVKRPAKVSITARGVVRVQLLTKQKGCFVLETNRVKGDTMHYIGGRVLDAQTGSDWVLDILDNPKQVVVTEIPSAGVQV